MCRKKRRNRSYTSLPKTQEYVELVIVVIPPNNNRLANKYAQTFTLLLLFIKLFR